MIDTLIMETIGDRLEQFAKIKFGSKVELAKALGMTPQALTAYYQNRTKPGLVIQNKLREVGCDIEWLITGKESSQSGIISNSTDLVKIIDEQETLIYRLTNEVKMLREEVGEYRSKRASLPR